MNWKYYRGIWEDKGDSIHWVKETQTPFTLFQRATYNTGSLDVRLKLSKNSELVSLILKGNAEGDRLKGYELAFNPQRMLIKLVRVENDSQVLAEREVKNLRDRWLNVRCLIENNRFKVFLNDDPQALFDIQDPKPLKQSGHFGVKAWGSYAQLDKAQLKTNQGTFDLVEIDRQATLKLKEGAPSEALKSFCLLILNLKRIHLHRLDVNNIKIYSAGNDHELRFNS